MNVRPFSAVRPTVAAAPQVAAVPYDVVDTVEAKALAAGNPASFLHVSRPEIDMPDGTDCSSPEAYAQAKKALDALRASGTLVQDPEPRFYAYRQVMGDHAQTGIVATFDTQDYLAGILKQHEKTRRDTRMKVRFIMEVAWQAHFVTNMFIRPKTEADSESRATNGASGNWKDVPADSVLHMGKGYIFRSSKEGNVGFPATEETHNAIFRSEAVSAPLVQYPAVESANAGWNFVGNPYPCFYDIYYMDFAAPITTWDVDNRTYKAYSAADDNFVLTPQQAFFVQKPSLVDAITFQPAGRQINKTIDHSALAMRRAARSQQVQRKLVDVSLTCADRTDRTRVVVNANASDDFCADNDAVKMMAYEGTPQIYTIAGADQLAVNEGAHRGGSVALGMYLPADDAYTIAVDRDELGVKLLDYGVEVEMPYTFSAAEGCLDDRFTLTFEAPTTGINTVATDADADNAIYTIDGRRVNSTAQKGIYIQNHKKIVK